MVSPSKMPSLSLPPLVMRKIFGSGHAGLYVSSRSTARGLAAERLLPGERHHIELGPIELLGECRRGGVTDGEAFAARADPVGIGNAHARGGAVPGEDDVGSRIGLAQVGDIAIAGMQLGHILELQFLDDVADPTFAK